MRKEHNYDAYNGDSPFLFASYSHTDTRRVESILKILFRQGFRLWYDQGGEGIPTGYKWIEWIDNRLDNSRSFLVFLSNGVENRPQVLREIDKAIELNEKKPLYKLIVVFLERMPISVFPENIKNFLEHIQFIPLYRYGGITEAFIHRLLGKNVWPDCIVDDLYRIEHGMGPWKDRRIWESDIQNNMDEMLVESQLKYIYYQAYPQMREIEGWKFYCVNLGETDPGAVYPLCMDNQWCPPEFYEEADFWENGFNSEKIRRLQIKSQKQEIYRALLHNWQVIVNRASFYNSQVFLDCYQQSKENYDAFCALLEEGSFVVFLMAEDTPWQAPSFATEGFQAWKKICREHVIYCLRMDWDSEESNSLEIDKLVGFQFQNFCLTTIEDIYRLDELEQIFQIPDEQKYEFREIWGQIQQSVLTREDIDENEGNDKKCNIGKKYSAGKKKSYRREIFYKKFLVREDSTVSECRLDRKKPFAKELKQIIDFIYSINLPQALNIQPLIPESTRLKNFALSERMLTSVQREVSTEELICAVVSFVPDFLEEKVPFLEEPEFELFEISEMRKMPEWRHYIMAVASSRKRAKQNEIDLYDIAAVWKRYQTWMKAVKERYPNKTHRETIGCVSVIYRFGENELITVYYANESQVFIKGNTSLGEMEIDHDTGSKRKTVLTIDFMCGDVLKKEVIYNCLLTEIRLFEGMTHEDGERAYKKVFQRFCKLPHRIV